tara:strand:- start:139 stop:519 length:381 start_codon:yes stop_codon:yes gene_type:complete
VKIPIVQQVKCVVVISNVVNPHQNVPEPDKLLSVMGLVENHVVMVTELAYHVAILVALVILRAAISTEQDYAKRVVVLVLLTHVQMVSAVMKEFREISVRLVRVETALEYVQTRTTPDLVGILILP